MRYRLFCHVLLGLLWVVGGSAQCLADDCFQYEDNCCGGRVMKDDQYCCNNQISYGDCCSGEPVPENGGCCGGTIYDPKLKSCENGKVV